MNSAHTIWNYDFMIIMKSADFKKDNYFKKLDGCFTQIEVRSLIQQVYADKTSHTHSEKINFLQKVYQHLDTIVFMDQKCKHSFYKMFEINRLLQSCTEIWQCDAILLHVRKNLNIYQLFRPLDGYKLLVDRRKKVISLKN